MRIPFNAKVRIKGIEHKSDQCLNGLTGTLSRKFFTRDGDNKFVFGDVGVVLDKEYDGARIVNVLLSEFEVI